MADLPPPESLNAIVHEMLGVKLLNVFAGFAGGTVRGLVVKGFSWPQRIASAVVGGITAGYATPAAMPLIRKWLDLWAYPTGDIEGSVGFALGLVGMTVCDAVIRWARRWRDGPPTMPMPPKSSG